MSAEIVTKKETPIEAVNTSYLQTLCLDIARNSKGAHKTFNKGEIKGKYVDDLTDSISELDTAIAEGDPKKIEKVFGKLEKLMARYASLDANMQIKPTYNSLNQKVMSVTESDSRNISAIREVLATVKVNVANTIARNANEKATQEQLKKNEEAELQRTIEANKDKARQDFNRGMQNAEARDKYITDLKGGAAFADKLAAQTYQGDPSSIVKAYEENTDRKKLHEMQEAIDNTTR